jgi:hypothetical protein
MIKSGWYLASKIFVSGAIVYSCMRLGRSVDEMIERYLEAVPKSTHGSGEDHLETSQRRAWVTDALWRAKVDAEAPPPINK